MSDERCPNPRCPHPRAMHSSRGCEAAIRAEGITYGRCACREKGSRDLTGVFVSDNPADSLRRELEALTQQTCENGVHGDWWADTEFSHQCPWCALEAARADERERLKATLRQIHWVTTYASGKFEGLPCCGRCAWLDGVRRPWPCDTLQAVGFTDDDIPAELRAVSDGN